MISRRKSLLGRWAERACQGTLGTSTRRRKRSRMHVSRTESLEIRVLLSGTNPDPVTGRIVNGEETSAFESVGMVNYGCSGTLISPTHVLTAAHCTVGVNDTGGTFQVNGQTYRTSRIVNHPDYRPNQIGSDSANDISIMVLDRPVQGVTPYQINRAAPSVGQLLTLVGFGGGGTGNSGHTGDFGTKRVGTTPIDGVSSTLITWNFDNNNESNTAPGDSGGPAFVEVNGTFLIAGVTSGGDRADAGIGDHSFDTRVDAYASWIDSVVGTPTPDPGPNPQPPADDHVNDPGPNATAITLTNGSGSASGTFEQAGDRDVFSILLDGDSEVTVAQTASSGGLDTYLRIYNENAELVAENDDSGGSLNSSLTQNLSAGTYYLQAGSYQDGGTGNYTVSVQVSATPDPDPQPDPAPQPDPEPPRDDHADDAGPNATPITLTDGVGTGSGQLEDTGDRDVFSVEVSAGGTLAVSVESTDGDLDTFLRLLDADGNVIAENDDSGGRLNSSLSQEVTAGTYYISVGAYADAGTGAYSVSVRFDETPVPPPEPAPTNGQEYFFSTQWGSELVSSDGSVLETTGSDIVKLVVMEDGSYHYEMYFDGSDVGLNGGAENVDAFAVLDDGSILLSTWRRARVPGLRFRPEDIVRFAPDSLGEDTVGSFSMYFDGGDTGLRGRAGNIDGISVLDTGQLILSTHGRQRLGGNTVNREDLVIFTPGNLGNFTSGNYRVYFDGSDVGLRRGRENLDAIDVTGDGVLHMSTRGRFGVQGGVTGGNSDVFAFSGTNLTRFTRGVFDNLTLVASSFGITGNLDGFQVGSLVQMDPGPDPAPDPDPDPGPTPDPDPGPGPASEYTIEVRFTDNTLSVAQQQVFTTAANRWSQIITGDVPDVVVDGLSVDDLVIDASAPFIDGNGGILGQAGPTALRSGSALPSRGIMEFDGADLAELEASGDLLNVILHEMGHVIGIGTIWGTLGLTQNVGNEIRFTGSQAVAEYQSIFRTSDNFVPVETDGGPGTAGGHWDEETFANELMTGFLDGGVANPISRVTVGALADMGYSVNLAAADAYAPPAGGSLRKGGNIVWGGDGHSHSHLTGLVGSDHDDHEGHDHDQAAFPIDESSPVDDSADDNEDEIVMIDPDGMTPMPEGDDMDCPGEMPDGSPTTGEASADESDSDIEMPGDFEEVDEILANFGGLLDVV